MNAVRWLPRRALITATLLALCAAAGLWLTWLIGELSGPISQSGHHDFFAFYAAATLVHQHQAQLLYDAPAVTAIERQIFNHPTGYAGYMPFLNPPSAAAVLSPLASLSEASARFVWLGVDLVCAALSAWLLTLGFSAKIRLLGVLAVFGTFPAFQTLVEGQWSYVMLLGALAAIPLARRNHPFLAGAALVVLWLKPPLFLLVVVWLVCTGRWRLLSGAVAAVAVLTLVTLPLTGIDANLNYVSYTLSVTGAHLSGGGAAGSTAWEGAFPNMEGLLGVAAAIVGQQHTVAVDVLTLVLSLLVVAVLVWTMHGRWTVRPADLQVVVAAMLAALLLDPHLYAQDCILLLLPVGVLLAPRVSDHHAVRLLLACCVLLDLATIDTLWSQGMFPAPLHLFTLCVAIAFLAACVRARRIQPQRGTVAATPAVSSTTTRPVPNVASPCASGAALTRTRLAPLAMSTASTWWPMRSVT
ncbi:MAG: DUF2029 domain-containing protein [Candidatus Dormibacteraeota bacterium]|nr:DUF2029 domain-containing protein [Candidatus Dormibacteraeota bacterium]